MPAPVRLPSVWNISMIIYIIVSLSRLTPPMPESKMPIGLASMQLYAFVVYNVVFISSAKPRCSSSARERKIAAASMSAAPPQLMPRRISSSSKSRSSASVSIVRFESRNAARRLTNRAPALPPRLSALLSSSSAMMPRRANAHESTEPCPFDSILYSSCRDFATIASGNPAVFDTFKKLTGIKLMEGFGQTETTLTVATMPWMQPKPGSMGLPNPQYDVDLIDYDGRSVEAGEQGQIVIRTDKGKPLGLFKEYYRDANRTHEAWHDNIYYTGDVAWKDEDGYLWFVGRADDVIKSSGYRIGPFEVESALMTHPAVIECAITGVPDEIRGQVVKATIVLSKDYKNRAGEELIKELQNHVKKVTAPYKYPRVIEFVDELPKTISGKIRRVEIRKNDAK